jgi:hypothetical protein
MSRTSVDNVQQLKMILEPLRLLEDVGDYDTRNKLVLVALGCALGCEYEAGIGIDPNEPDWPVVYIDLPTGQVSWHIEPYKGTWDGHTTEDKYRRIARFVFGQ